jgi:hypothetical protein
MVNLSLMTFFLFVNILLNLFDYMYALTFLFTLRIFYVQIHVGKHAYTLFFVAKKI